MWPFSRSKREEDELFSRSQWMRDVDLRLKSLEREHDDLHAAYRRLRGQRAVEAKAEHPARTPEALVDDPGAPSAPFDKQALRRKYLNKPPGNGS
jgi:hypothetical protein